MELEHTTKKGLVILGLATAALICMIIGFYLGQIPLLLAVVLAIFTYILHFDEKRKGSVSPLARIGNALGLLSGFISLLFLINSFL